MKLHFMDKNFKNTMVLTAGLWSYIILFVMRIFLTRIIGDAGVGLFAPAFELFWLVTLLTSCSMSKAMSGLIKYRVKRAQHRNAGKVFRAAFTLNLFVSIVAAVLLAVVAGPISEIVVLEPFCRMAILAAAVSVVFASLIGTFRGYFNGYGMGILVAHSHLIEKISMTVCAALFGGLFYSYGEKVSVLLLSDQYAYEYGALGAMIGVMLSQVITVVYLLAIYVIYAFTLRGRLEQDATKKRETQSTLQRLLFNNSLPLAFCLILSNVLILIDQRMFNYSMNMQERGGVRTALWGCYYGKFSVLIGICSALVCIGVYSLTTKISYAFEHEEYHAMRERIGKAVRKVSIFAFPMAIYLAVLAEAFVKTIYKGMTDETVSLVQKGTVLIVLYGFGFLFGQLLYKIHMVRELLIITLFSALLHLAAAFLLVQKSLMGAEGIVYALILFWAVFMGIGFFLVSRKLKYRQSWLTDVVFPALAAAVSGLAVLFLNRLLLESAGALVSILVSCLVGIFLYVLLLMITRVLGEAELSRMPLGFFFLLLGRNIGIF
jgi:stage V sporulation protein B